MKRARTHRACIYAVIAILVLFPGIQRFPTEVYAGQTPNPQGLEAPEFTIKILEGEDAVNIIKTKTAVKPVVEVRDKNNLPVAGVAVFFAVPQGAGASATFAHGSRFVSVLTNSAGRAAVTSMKPIGTGTFRIGVAASFQSKVVATTTIVQTNYPTLAAATAASTTAAGTTAATTSAAGTTAAGTSAAGAAAGTTAATTAAVTAATSAGVIGATTGISAAVIGAIAAGAAAAAGIAAKVISDPPAKPRTTINAGPPTINRP